MSGYLITKKILGEINRTGRFDLSGFVADRAKRLLPNATFVLIATIIAAAAFLPAYRIETILADARWAALFSSNIRFAETAVDYFSIDKPPSPLLHFWSLSVEEQFYFLWPLVLFFATLIWGRRGATFSMRLLMLLGCASFVTSLLDLSISQPKAYFLTHNRLWQLGLGGIIAGGAISINAIPDWLKTTAALLGCMLIGYAMVAFDEQIAYPGLWALIPTLGAAGLIVGLDSSSAQKLRAALSCSPLIWVGDRSYSLYLWHWPILVIANVVVPDNTPSGQILLMLSILVVSHLAYRFIEAPLHNLHWRPSSDFIKCCMPLICGSSVAFLTVLPTGVTVSVSADRAALIKLASIDVGRNYADKCHLDFETVEQPECVYGPDRVAVVALFGDSHAAQWFEPLRTAANERAKSLEALTKTSCPSVDVTIWYPPSKATYTQCDDWRETIFQRLTRSPPEIIFIANFSNYGGWIEDRKTGRVLNGDAARREWQAGLERTLAKIRSIGSKVVVIKDNPAMYADYLDCVSLADNCSRPRDQALQGIADDARSTAGFANSRLLDFSDNLCTENSCPAEIDQRLIYQDRHHLRASFTEGLWQRFSPYL